MSAGVFIEADGVEFKLYAPHADEVWVLGEFSEWNLIPLRKEGQYFKGKVSGARPGQQYQFQIRHGEMTFKKNDPRSMQISERGSSVIVDHGAYQWQNTEYKRPPHDEVVIYEIHPESFAGGLEAMEAKLEHARQLGANMILLTPQAESIPGDTLGYAPAYPFAARRRISPDTLKKVIDKAHGMGMGVIIDVVHNHWAGENFENFDGPSFGTGGLYYYNDHRAFTPWGHRPNYGRREVQEFIIDNARMWLGDYHADGLRWDSTEHIRLAKPASQDRIPEGEAVLREVNSRVEKEFPGAVMIAEDLKNDPYVDLPVMFGGLGFSAQKSQEVHYPLKDVLSRPSDGERDMGKIQYAVTHSISYVPMRQIVFTENHDVTRDPFGARMPDVVDPRDPNSAKAKKLASLGASVMMTTAGMPWLFMGQEFHSTGKWEFNQPMDWKQLEKNPGTFKLYQDLVALRKNTSGNTAGLTGNHTNFFHRNDKDKVVAYHRWRDGGPGDDVVVIANFSDKRFPDYYLGLPRGGKWNVRFNGDLAAYGDGRSTPDLDAPIDASALPKDNLNFAGTVNLPPYSVLILSQDKK